MSRHAVFALLLLFAAGCSTPAPRPAVAPQVTVKLISFSDFHGFLQPPASPTRLAGAPGEPETQLPTGGVAWLAGQVQALQRQNPRHVVVSAGDLFGGSPLLSSLLRHEPTIAALNQVGLEFSALGNHEFDRGLPELRRLAGMARFQYLAANIRDERTGERVFPAWARKRMDLPGGGHVDVAFIGALPRSMPSLVNGAHLAGLRFPDEAEAVNEVVREVRAAGIEAIVVLMHEGGYTDSLRFDDPGCPGFRGNILAIVDALDLAVDLVMSAHTHTAFVCQRNGRTVTSTGAEGRLLADVDLAIDTRSGDVAAVTARLLPVVNDTRPNPLAERYPGAAPDAALQAQVRQWEQSIVTQAQRAVGSAATPLTRDVSAAGESSLGSVVADAQRQATAGAGAQIAVANSSGLRADLGLQGTIRYEEVFAVHPFGNFLVTMTLTGREIHTLLETQWQGAGSTLQVSAGFEFRWRASAPPGERIAPGDIRLNGAPLQPDAPYRVTVSDFLAGGGDGYAVLRQGRDRVVGAMDVEALEAWAAAHSPLAAPPAGRIIRLP